MTPERFHRICTVLNARQPDLTVITDKVHKPHNLSAIIRTCDAVGIDTIHSVRPDGGFSTRRGTAMGSQKWVETEVYATVDEPIASLKEKGHQIVAAHLSERAINFRDIDYTRPTALLLGTEKYGVSNEALQNADQHIIVPMLGMVESFNVSVACAIVLSEAQRQRSIAGLYSQRRIGENIYKKRLFAWAQPVIREFCDRKGIDYPALDANGEIIDLAEWHQSVKHLPDID